MPSHHSVEGAMRAGERSIPAGRHGPVEPQAVGEDEPPVAVLDVEARAQAPVRSVEWQGKAVGDQDGGTGRETHAERLDEGRFGAQQAGQRKPSEASASIGAQARDDGGGRTRARALDHDGGSARHAGDGAGPDPAALRRVLTGVEPAGAGLEHQPGHAGR